MPADDEADEQTVATAWINVKHDDVRMSIIRTGPGYDRDNTEIKDISEDTHGGWTWCCRCV